MTVAEPKPPCSNRQNYHVDNLPYAVKPTPLKIALLGYRSHPHVGGQGIYIKYLSRALSQLGHTVDVISGPPYPELDSNITLVKVPSLDLFAQEDHVTALKLKHLRSYTNTFEWWSMLTGGFAEPYTFGRRVRKLLSSKTYDIIHDNQSLCYALLDLQKSGLNVISTIHHPIHMDRQIALNAAQKWGDRLLIKRWYSFLGMQEKVVRGLDNIITVSATSQQDIARYFSRSTQHTPIISNGIDTDTFRPNASIPKQRHHLITTASSDQPLKGLVYLLEAVAALTANYPDIHLQVIGQLKQGGETEKLLHALDLKERVSFTTGISTEKLVHHYARAHLAICPSLYEGFGLPAGEAMACKLPVIATDGGALPEVIGDAGIIVPKGDSKALADKIALLFDDDDKAASFGARARTRILEQFSWQKVAQSLTHYYHNVIHRAHN